MHRGYVKLWRKSLDTRIFGNAPLWKVWCWCLMRATHKEEWIPVQTGNGQTEVHLLPGQFLFGRKKASKELKMKPSSVRNRIEKLKSIGNLDIKSDTHYSIISINKWADYQMYENTSGQVVGQPKDNQRTTKGQPKDTFKNNKNNKNKEKSPADADKIKITDQVAEKLYRDKKFLKVHAFVNKMRRAGVNESALCHILLGFSKRNIPEGSAWAYCTKALQIEHGNFNEAEHFNRVEKQKREFEEWVATQ